jgi:hypothetical protein
VSAEEEGAEEFASSAWPPIRDRRSVVPRRLLAFGSGIVAQRCLVGIEQLPGNDFVRALSTVDYREWKLRSGAER